MKQRTWDAFLEHKFYNEDDLLVWPTITELSKRIVDSAEYKALRDIGLPQVHERKNIQFEFYLKTRTPSEEKLINWRAHRTANAIYDKWQLHHVHACLSLGINRGLFLTRLIKR